MATTTVEIDTELSAVNSILGAIGQAPVTTLDFDNPEVAFVYNILAEVNKDVQNEGWHFNTEYHVEVTPDGSKNITIPNNYLRYDLHGPHDKTMDLVRRNGKLYDLVDHTDEFDNNLDLDIVYLYAFEDVPPVFQRYIIARAASRAAAQLIANPQLVQLLKTEESVARASIINYECEQGDHSFLGHRHDTAYKSYQPFDALRR